MRGDANSNLVKIWNHMATAHFPGISDRPEHIAGIIGNMMCEAGEHLCPFQIQVSNQVGLGLMQWSFDRRIALENYMFSHGVSRTAFFNEVDKHNNTYVCRPGNHPQALLDRVLELQIAFMFHELRNSESRYMTYVDFPTARTGSAGARAYAELFCSLNLRPGAGTGADNILDIGVQNALRASPHAGGAGNLDRISYSALTLRRNRAETVFLQFQANHR
jgi:hypothetical protein